MYIRVYILTFVCAVSAGLSFYTFVTVRRCKYINYFDGRIIIINALYSNDRTRQAALNAKRVKIKINY